PDRPPLIGAKGWVAGTWMIGSCYKNPNKLYGAYPHGYLDRVHSMFPDARKILHVFSGGLILEAATEVASKYCSPELIELIDLHGPAEGRYPTWQGDLFEMPREWFGRF